ncbi:MAG: YtxH domain-containing protein [Ndongobacter sp.]|nr:YtxH domain-containing protein [Ndongobacter sp.]
MGIAEYLEQKKRAQIRRARREDAKRVSLGLVVGAALGSAAGLLFAPKSGAETREDIASAAKNAAETIKVRSSEAMQAVKEKTTDTLEKARNMYSEHVESKMTSIRPAIDEVEEGLEELKEEIEE